jgi:hypothetical protein
MVGDILLIYSMLYGTIAFILGHVFYVLAFTNAPWLLPLELFLMLGGIFVTIGTIFTIDDYRKSGSVFWRLIGLLYLLFISSMVMFAINYDISSKSTKSIPLVGIGAVLFMMSDFLLVFLMRTKKSPIPFGQGFILVFYYLAQTAITFGVFWDHM